MSRTNDSAGWQTWHKAPSYNGWDGDGYVTFYNDQGEVTIEIQVPTKQVLMAAALIHYDLDQGSAAR